MTREEISVTFAKVFLCVCILVCVLGKTWEKLLYSIIVYEL